jgi:hypothetical protein
MRAEVLIIVEFFEFAVLDSAEKDRDLVWVELANHLGLLPPVGPLHLLYINYKI